MSYAAIWYQKHQHSVYYRTNQDTGESFTFSFVMIAEYTKTTDSADVSYTSSLTSLDKELTITAPEFISASASSAKYEI